MLDCGAVLAEVDAAMWETIVLNLLSNAVKFTFQGSITVNTGFSSPVGLWALAFGNGVTGRADTLYFTAGVNNQKDGLFGSISIPEPGSALLLTLGAASLGLLRVVSHGRRSGS